MIQQRGTEHIFLDKLQTALSVVTKQLWQNT